MQFKQEVPARLIHTIKKGPRQEIRVSLARFKGRDFADLRLFVPNEIGQWIPTMKGCTIGLDQLGELHEAVRKLREEVENGEASTCG